MRAQNLPQLQRHAENSLSPAQSHIKLSLYQKQKLHFYANLPSWAFQKAYHVFPWKPKNGKLSVHVCVCAFSLGCQKRKSTYTVYMTWLPLQHQYSDLLRHKAMSIPSMEVQKATIPERCCVPPPSLCTHITATSFAATTLTLQCLSSGLSFLKVQSFGSWRIKKYPAYEHVVCLSLVLLRTHDILMF